MTQEHDAFLAGRIAGEDALGLTATGAQLTEKDALSLFGERAEQLGAATGHDQQLLTEFGDGWHFTMANYREPNFRLVPEHGRIRAMRLLSGEQQSEEHQATLTVAPETADKVHKLLEAIPEASLDQIITMGLDCFTYVYEGETGHIVDEELNMTELAEKIAYLQPK